MRDGHTLPGQGRAARFPEAWWVLGGEHGLADARSHLLAKSGGAPKAIRTSMPGAPGVLMACVGQGCRGAGRGAAPSRGRSSQQGVSVRMAMSRDRRRTRQPFLCNVTPFDKAAHSPYVLPPFYSPLSLRSRPRSRPSSAHEAQFRPWPQSFCPTFDKHTWDSATDGQRHWAHHPLFRECFI